MANVERLEKLKGYIDVGYGLASLSTQTNNAQSKERVKQTIERIIEKICEEILEKDFFTKQLGVK